MLVEAKILKLDESLVPTGLSIRSMSVRAWRDLLVKAAHKVWGGSEGRDWRIASDTTIFGMKAVHIQTGEVIELH